MAEALIDLTVASQPRAKVVRSDAYVGSCSMDTEVDKENVNTANEGQPHAAGGGACCGAAFLSIPNFLFFFVVPGGYETRREGLGVLVCT